jgi:hypothetical protein
LDVKEDVKEDIEDGVKEKEAGHLKRRFVTDEISSKKKVRKAYSESPRSYKLELHD